MGVTIIDDIGTCDERLVSLLKSRIRAAEKSLGSKARWFKLMTGLDYYFGGTKGYKKKLRAARRRRSQHLRKKD